MFLLTGLVSLLVAGMASDISDAEDEGNEDTDALPPETEELPRIMPADEYGTIWDTSSIGPVTYDAPDPLPPGSIDPEPVDPPPAEGEEVNGTDQPDQLMGGEGDDSVNGAAGDDDLRGGQGDDTIFAGDGNDWAQGDASYGPGGNDEIHGGAGNDLLAGQGGDDIIWGDEGDDTILGGEGDDTLFGGSGNDWLSGNDGNDVLVSGGGADDLDGGRGDDLLIGDDDPETVWMHGGEGDDTLMPGAGDFAEGQDGADTFALKLLDGALPTIADFNGEEDELLLHLPESIADDAKIGLQLDQDDSWLVTVNDNPVGRLLHLGGLRVEDIAILRIPG